MMSGPSTAIPTFLGGDLASLGFRRLGDLSYGRHEGEGTALLSFSSRRDAAGDGYWFSLGVGVRFPEIEALVHPSGSDELASTIGVPVHILTPSRTFKEWHLGSKTDPAVIRTDVLAYISDFALPFLAKFSTRTAVYSALASPDPKNWFALTQEQRVLRLAAIEFLQGKRDQAISHLDTALESLEAEPRKKWVALRALRDRIGGA